MDPVVLYEDAELVVLHRQGASDFTLVTFADLTARPRPNWFWGAKPAEQYDLDCIGFVAKAANWYPAANMRRAAAAVRAAAKPIRIGYGYSMGAHAALKHGGLLGLRSALAVAPQVSIDPADRIGSRYTGHFRPHWHGAMRLAAADLPNWAVVLADPYDAEDRDHLDHLPPHPGLHILPAAFMGHWAIWLLTHAETLMQALACVRHTDLAGLRQLVRAQRARTDLYFLHLACAALRHDHPGWANRLLARARALGLSPAVECEQVAQTLAARAARQHEAGRDAGATLAAMFAALPSATDPTSTAHATLYSQLGHHLLPVDAAIAETLFQRALRADPAQASAHFGHSHTRLNQQDRAGAVRAAAAALRHAPDDPELIAWAGHLLVTDHPRQAEFFFRTALAMQEALLHAQIGLSRALARQGRRSAALAVVRTALRAHPGDAGLRQRLAELGRMGPGWRIKTLLRQLRPAADGMAPEIGRLLLRQHPDPALGRLARRAWRRSPRREP